MNCCSLVFSKRYVSSFADSTQYQMESIRYYEKSTEQLIKKIGFLSSKKKKKKYSSLLNIFSLYLLFILKTYKINYNIIILFIK